MADLKRDEKSKMLSGEWFNAIFDPVLTQERFTAKDLCFDFNNTRPSDIKKQREILKKLLPNCNVEKLSVLAPLMVDYGYNITIGDGCYLHHNCHFIDAAEITIGTNCFIGPNCGFRTTVHPIDHQRRIEGLEKATPIKIGNNVWIGDNVQILPGVTIGNGAIIAAGSVVTNDISAESVAMGAPARITKKLFRDAII